MGQFAESVWMTETSARAGTLCRLNARMNRVSDRTSVAIAADFRALPVTFDAVAFAPREYVPADVVEQRMADAITILTANGTMYLAATRSSGLTRYERTFRDLCDAVTTVDNRDSVTVLRGKRPPDFSPLRYAEPRSVSVTINGISLSLVTYPGLFSASTLDSGTRRLAESLEIEDGERVLDLCCGYGPLGIYAARTADCTVTLTDDDCVATACAHKSAEMSGVSDVVDVLTADGVAGVRGSTYDRVVCNPPTHAGSSVLHELLSGARDVLTDRGVVQLVHHRGISFEKYLHPHFKNVSAEERGEYRIVTTRS